MRRSNVVQLVAFAVALSNVGCAAQARRFPLRAPLWVDNDTRPVATRPRGYWSPLVWDGADQQFFRPISQALSVQTHGEAVDVNALDEVPDSSWYTNRLSVRDISADEMGDGACDGHPLPDAYGPWTVLSSKPNGTTAGFVAIGPDGHRYVMKADGDVQPEQMTSAEVIASRIFWAAGFNVACNRVLSVRREQFRPGPHAYFEDSIGHRHPMTDGNIDDIFRMADPKPDGTYRVVASLYVDGTPLGPFTYQGVRSDDLNDVVPHEDRRELRGSKLLSAWLNHWDSREQNTLTTWIPVGQGGYVRHYIIDLGDSLGSLWPIDPLARRIGYSGYFDIPMIVTDFVALGLIDRPWDRIEPNMAWPFGYYVSTPFDPDGWRGGYPNPAYHLMTERDAAWMARIIARISDEDIHRLVSEAHLSMTAWQVALESTIRARRDRILERYLTRLSPLTDVVVTGNVLCASDRAVEAHVFRHVQYTATIDSDVNGRALGPLPTEPNDGNQVCVTLPMQTATQDHFNYRVVELHEAPDDRAAPAPLRAHLYDLGPDRGWVLAGIER